MGWSAYCRDGGSLGSPVAWVVLGLAVILGGCGFIVPNQIHYAWDDERSAACENCVAKPGETLIGLAFSGGGSRAAVFAAAAAEALHRRALLQHVTHLSSVSGGSFAAAYIGLKAPHRCGEAEASGPSPCTAANFDAFTDMMRRDYFWTMELNQFKNPWRVTAPTYRVTSLVEVLDSRYLGGRTFRDLKSKPIVLFNAADYDDGSRFIFSNRAFPALHNGSARYRQAALSANSFSRNGKVRATPADFPIALAVATSAAFPGLLGPVTIQMPAHTNGKAARRCKEKREAPPAECEYWHLGDGGILENTGVETLQEVLLGQAKNAVPFRRALILSFDAGRRLDTPALRQDEDPDFWVDDFDRVVEIAGIRAEAYRAIVWEHIRKGLKIPYRLVSMRMIDAKLTEEDWPASCPPETRHKGGIRQHLRTIPTHLDISTCDADLTEAAARWLVEHAMTPALMAQLARQGFALGTGTN